MLIYHVTQSIAMVDLVYGRGITDLLREMPFYISIFKKMTAYRLFKTKQPMYGSVDVNNVCNLHCTHCYWWLNRKEEEQDMSVEDWRRIIREKFNKQHIFVTTLVGGEPTLRPDILEVFCEMMPKRVCVVTNATFPLKRYDGLYFYWVSMDGTEAVHDSMRGKGGGVGTTPVQCPSWAILSLDHMGRVKQPCCIGSADSKGLKPICEECGLGCYSILVAQGITGS